MQAIILQLYLQVLAGVAQTPTIKYPSNLQGIQLFTSSLIFVNHFILKCLHNPYNLFAATLHHYNYTCMYL